MSNHVNHQAHDRLTKHAKLRLLRDKVVKTLKGVDLTKAGKPLLDSLYKLQTELRAITPASGSEAAKLLSGAIGVLSRRLGNEALQEFMAPAPIAAVKKPIVSKRVNGKAKAFAAPPGKPLSEDAYLNGLAEKHGKKKVTKAIPVTTTITIGDLEQEIKSVEGFAVVFRYVSNFVIPKCKGYPYKQRLPATATNDQIASRVRKALQGTKFSDISFVIVRGAPNLYSADIEKKI